VTGTDIKFLRNHNFHGFRVVVRANSAAKQRLRAALGVAEQRCSAFPSSVA
jgi:hypothetical protein